MPIMTWINTKVNDVKSFASETVSQLQSATSYVFSNYFYKYYDVFVQGWGGLSRVIDPANIPTLFHENLKRTRDGLKQTFSTNILLYMGSVLLYETAIKSMLRSLVPGMKDSYAETATDLLAWSYFMYTSFHAKADNTINNISTSDAVVIENPNKQQLELHVCNPNHANEASILSPFYFAGNLLTAKFVSSLFPYGNYVSLPLRALAYGQSLFEYNLGSLCTKHRNELFQKNNPYLLGMGLSLLGTVEVFRLGIRRATGVDNALAYDALFSAVFLYYILLARLINKPLPGQTKGRDYFYYGRFVVDAILKQISYIPSISWSEGIKNCKKFYELFAKFPPSDLVLKFVRADFEKYLKKPPIQRFLDLYGDGIQETIKWAESLRKQYLPRYVPNAFLSIVQRIALNILLTEEFKACDLRLISIDEMEKIDKDMLENTRKERIPILIKTKDKFVIYGDPKENGNWELTEIKTTNVDLNKLPFEKGLMTRDHELFTSLLLETLKKGHPQLESALERLDKFITNIRTKTTINDKNKLKEIAAGKVINDYPKEEKDELKVNEVMNDLMISENQKAVEDATVSDEEFDVEKIINAFENILEENAPSAHFTQEEGSESENSVKNLHLIENYADSEENGDNDLTKDWFNIPKNESGILMQNSIFKSPATKRTNANAQNAMRYNQS